ncbi:uncharacterized protein LOC132204500 [Neocloeon triangulifer]|uniref:uncharacterized protein LOC132204500 n=1 Tax=Neocloeon triangulifer TaxID=2078957 RepID=UPI00286F7779|nr:uncharacterized protein LOC132204500 [Neocloeon triangulifer]XP_059489017.1 uncharacterized protein LOC132204500 [Neocloeon triangulifer]
MGECSRVNLADVVLRLEGGSSLVCHCTRAKFPSSARISSNNQIINKADHEKQSLGVETFSDDFEQIFQFDEQQSQAPLPFVAEERWSFLNQTKSFGEDSSPSLSWSSSSDSMTSVTSLDEAMLSLSSSDSDEEDSQKARFSVDAVEDSLNRLSISPLRQNGNSRQSSLTKSLGQAWIIPVQEAMRYFGFHFLPTNEDLTITSTEIISHQKDKQAEKSKRQLSVQKLAKKEIANGDWLCHLAKRGASDLVVDAVCGDGALAIYLAQNCQRVLALDPNPVNIKQALHRAKLSGVSHKIDFIQADFFRMKMLVKVDAVFVRLSNSNASFEEKAVCDLNAFRGQQLFQQARFISNNVVFCLPSNQDARQVLQLVGKGEMELEQCCIEGQFSAMAAYTGPLFDQSR